MPGDQTTHNGQEDIAPAQPVSEPFEKAVLEGYSIASASRLEKALGVTEAARAFNAACEQACAAGLIVIIDTSLTVRTIGRRDRPVLRVDVTQPLSSV